MAGAGIDLRDIMQADLFLAIASRSTRNDHTCWYPDTLILNSSDAPFPIFARCKSSAYFDRLGAGLGLTPERVRILIKEIEDKGGFFRGMGHFRPSLESIVATDKLATMP